MSKYCSQGAAVDYFNFSSSAQAPVKAVVCSFEQGGVGIPLTIFSMFFFGVIGLALANRIQHPAPVVVAFMLTAGVAAFSVSGNAINILAIVLFMAISGLGIWVYARANTSI